MSTILFLIFFLYSQDGMAQDSDIAPENAPAVQIEETQVPETAPQEETGKAETKAEVKPPKRELRAVGESLIPYEERRQISLDYFQGPALILDCEKQFYACVDMVSYDRCQERHGRQKMTKAEERFTCLPIKKWVDLKTCQAELKKLVDLPRRKELCRIESATRATH